MTNEPETPETEEPAEVETTDEPEQDGDAEAPAETTNTDGL